MADLQKAIRIAVEAHFGKKDKHGAPYILHPLRVMFRLKSEPQRIVAVLHDVVEKTSVRLEDLQQAGFSPDILTAIDCMTKREGEPYEDYISRVEKHSLARSVKIADLEDNLDLQRFPQISEKELEKMPRRHAAWLRLLKRE